MPIQNDYDPATAARLQDELWRFSGECWYDESLKRIVYRSAEAALRAYLVFQREEMDRHKWIESEKASRDLRDRSLADWVRRHSMAFSCYWRKTHVFVPPLSPAESPT
jgi:hypothetical protein